MKRNEQNFSSSHLVKASLWTVYCVLSVVFILLGMPELHSGMSALDGLLTMIYWGISLLGIFCATIGNLIGGAVGPFIGNTCGAIFWAFVWFVPLAGSLESKRGPFAARAALGFSIGMCVVFITTDFASHFKDYEGIGIKHLPRKIR